MPDARELELAAERIAIAMQVQRPVHLHVCPHGPHRWPCPSPYCEDVSTRPRSCPGHGGEYPRDTTVDDFEAADA